MHKIIYSSHVRRVIRSFILYRADYFERLYSDTGIFSEDIIVWRHISESEMLFDSFMEAIVKDISKWILGNIYNKVDDYEYSRLVIKSGSHILIVWFKRSLSEDIVFVEDIEIRT